MESTDSEPISLLVAAELGNKAADELYGRVRPYLNVGPPQHYHTRADPSVVVEKLIQLIGSAPQWIVLGAAATTLLASVGSAIGKRAGEDLYDLVKSKLKGPETAPLATIGGALATAVDKLGPRAAIVVGLDIPDSFLGTAVLIRDREPAKIALAVARFAAHAEELSILMKAEVDAGHAPFGRAVVTFEDDATVVRWVSQQDYKERELRIGRGLEP